MTKTRVIAILALPDFQLLDAAGPLDVFAAANDNAGRSVYDLRVVAAFPGPIRSSSGTRVLPDQTVDDPPPAKVDTFLVAGCLNVFDFSPSPRLLRWLE